MSEKNLAPPSQIQEQVGCRSDASEHIEERKGKHDNGDITGDETVGSTEEGNQNATIQETEKGETNDALNDVISKYLMNVTCEQKVASIDNANGMVANTLAEDIYPYNYLYPNGGVESCWNHVGNPEHAAFTGISNFVVSQTDEAATLGGNQNNNTCAVQLGTASDEYMLHPNEDTLANQNSHLNYIGVVNNMCGNYEPYGGAFQNFNYHSEEEFFHDANANDVDGYSDTYSEMKSPPPETTQKRKTYSDNMDMCGPTSKMRRKGINNCYSVEETHKNGENNLEGKKNNLYRNNSQWKTKERSPSYLREHSGLYKGAFKKWDRNQIGTRERKEAGEGGDNSHDVVGKKPFLSKWDNVDEGGDSCHQGVPPGETCYNDSRGNYLGRASQFGRGRSSQYGKGRAGLYGKGRSTQYGRGRLSHVERGGRSLTHDADKSTQDDRDRFGKYNVDQPNQYGYNGHSQYKANKNNQYDRDEAVQYERGKTNRHDRGHAQEAEENRDTYRGRKYKCNIFDEECYIIECKSYGSEEMEVPGPLNSMEDLCTLCGNNLYRNICEKGYSQMTTVQKYSIPIIMKKMNLIASSQTGSGKTFSFLCPVVTNLMKDNDTLRPHFPGAYACVSPLGLVLCPTRELVLQILHEVNSLTKKMGLVCMAFYGGETMKDQVVQINERQADIIVSTPGRLLDLMNSCKVSLSFVKYLILDEADEMISLGLKEQMNAILFEQDLCANDARQTILFTATFSDSLREDIEQFMATPYVFLNITQKREVRNSIKQVVKYVPAKSKQDELLKDLKTLQGQAIIFVELRSSINYIFSLLKSNGYNVNYLHGKMSQARRQAVFQQFRDKGFQVLIATSIAARGLDFPDLELVINYDLPAEFEQYMHRIGRTGRIGKTGLAINYFNSSNKIIIDKLIDHLRKYDQNVPQWLLNFK
ncbi:hypothetical protein AK88_03692 [Plasmodium fragile]|uniref:RNA helicase n=1 Tax=Plasmodium fragile TaxID=5857 RepID=A0A0D9QHZ6_PLAFR|nr:uncharacterized protein AK88_03692 [Plasmodium fragile]KJP86685.1 hypothetical protein AK88_03692 [Plasmodium fragile]